MMSHPRTSVWTDAHLGLITGATILAALGALAASGSAGPADVALSTLAVTLTTFVIASFTDAFGGMLVGLIASAVFTAIHQYLPDAAPMSFAIQALTLGLLLLLGMTSGLVADRVRRGRRIATRNGGQAIATVEGSLGLLTAADAELTLDHERVRAQLHGRPLTTVLIDVVITEMGLTSEEVRRARRAVARSLETELRVTDIVYLDAEDRFGAILPETTQDAASDIVESALIVARAATFADRRAGHRRPVAEVATLDVEITQIVGLAPAEPIATAETLAEVASAPRAKARRPGTKGAGSKSTASRRTAPQRTAPERLEAR